MEYIWMLEEGDDGDVVSEVHGTILRIRFDMWEHACLDVEIEASVATQRKQGGAASDDPLEWETLSSPLRKVNDRWELYVEEDVKNRWIATLSDIVDKRQIVADSPPHQAYKRDSLSRAMRQRDQIMRLGCGWVPLSLGVSDGIISVAAEREHRRSFEASVDRVIDEHGELLRRLSR